MRVAIYARKSNDDNDKNAENKSVVRQVENARAYALARGWTVDDDAVFVDDGVSGAEYVNRPGFARLMTSLKAFDALVMSEASRLGRDMARNTAFVIDLVENGKRIFYYLTGEEERADTPEQRIMVTLRGYASEVERLKAGQRSRDALARKAGHGFNAGGRVYGFDNVQVRATAANGEAIRSHTDYRINPAEADVLRRIFTMYAGGHGHVTIAKAMNGDAQYARLSKQYFDGLRPAPPRGKTGSWAPSSIRAMLYNERYLGAVIFGKHRKVYRRGTKARVKQAPGEILRVERPDLRIIPEELWHAVQERLAAARKTYIRDNNGQVWGRPGAGVESKYLLTGLSECGVCGRSITMLGGRSGVPGKRSRLYYYGCSYHANRGRTVCANAYRAEMDEADDVVLTRIGERVLTPEAIEWTVERSIEKLAERRRQDQALPERLEAELRKDRKQLDNLVAAIAAGNAPAAVLERIRALEAVIAAKAAQLSGFAVETPSEADWKRLRRALRERLGRFNDLMRGDVPVARQALRKLLAGRIKFTPAEMDGAMFYRLEGASRLGPLLDAGYIEVATPRTRECIPVLRAVREVIVARRTACLDA